MAAPKLRKIVPVLSPNETKTAENSLTEMHGITPRNDALTDFGKLSKTVGLD